MPGARRQPRQAAQPPLTLGVAGSGELDQKATVALLDDLVAGREVNVVYLPVSKDDTTDEIIHVHRWCVTNEIPYEVFSEEADVKADKDLKKIVEGAAADYAISDEGAGKDIVSMLESTEDDPVEDGRMLMFFKTEEEVDLDVFEAAQELGVDVYDICDDMSKIKVEDDGGEPPAAPEPPQDEVGARRGRRASKDSEPEPPAKDSEPAGDYSKEEQKRYDSLIARSSPLTELKKTLRELDSSVTVDELKGVDKAYVADRIILAERDQEPGGDGGGGDEAQASVPPARGRRGRAAAAEEPSEAAGGDDDGEDPKEAVFARLRASRERAEYITQNLVRSLGAIADEGEPDEVIERAAAAVAASLMLFAEYVITEVRKPKSAGRPRADGTEAQPKPPVDPDAPKRGRGRPRKDAD